MPDRIRIEVDIAKENNALEAGIMRRRASFQTDTAELTIARRRRGATRVPQDTPDQRRVRRSKRPEASRGGGSLNPVSEPV